MAKRSGTQFSFPNLLAYTRGRQCGFEACSPLLVWELTCLVAVAQFLKFSGETAFKSWWLLLMMCVSRPDLNKAPLSTPLLVWRELVAVVFQARPEWGLGGSNSQCLLGLWESREQIWWINPALSHPPGSIHSQQIQLLLIQQLLLCQPSRGRKNAPCREGPADRGQTALRRGSKQCVYNCCFPVNWNHSTLWLLWKGPPVKSSH